MATVILDPAHGGNDPGRYYEGRWEKNDSLRLTLAVGEILKNKGVDVYYTRTNDNFISPTVRAKNANQLDGDLLVAIHRGGAGISNSISGARAFIFEENGINVEAANNVLDRLEDVGLRNLGLDFRDDYILRYTNIPSLALVVGYVNNENDNKLFDEKFLDIANAIAMGILDSLNQT